MGAVFIFNSKIKTLVGGRSRFCVSPPQRCEPKQFDQENTSPTVRSVNPYAPINTSSWGCPSSAGLLLRRFFKRISTKKDNQKTFFV
jgi:hypothetical protein